MPNWSEPPELVGQGEPGADFSNHDSHEDPSPQVQEFVQKYRERFAEVPDGLAAPGYDAARILFQALQQAGSLAGRDLAAELAAVRDFRGVTGTISISPERHVRGAMRGAFLIAPVEQFGAYYVSSGYRFVPKESWDLRGRRKSDDHPKSVRRQVLHDVTQSGQMAIPG